MNKLAEALYSRLSSVKKMRREIAKYPRRRRVIDVGCGSGANTAHLASISDEVVGIDIDQKKIDTARRLYPHLNFIRMDAAKTDFSNGQFDTAFLIMFLHEACTDGVIREVCRIAGEVVVIDYSRVLYGLWGKLIRLIEKDKYERYAGLNLTLKFKESGFSLKESRSFHPNFYIYFFVSGKSGKNAGKLSLAGSRPANGND